MRVLIVEDATADSVFVQLLLEQCFPVRLEVHVADSLSAARDVLAVDTFDCVLLELSLPDSKGLASLRQLMKAAARTPIVVLSGLADESVALEAVRIGAMDFVCRNDLSPAALGRCMRHAVERKKMSLRADYLSQHDGLTGAASSEALLARLEAAAGHAAENAELAAFILVQVTRLGRINDVHGTDAGDAVLRELVQRLAKSLRAGDVIGRLGGDEIGIVIDRIEDETSVYEIAERLLREAAAPYRHDDTSLRPEIEVGIVLIPEDAIDVESILAEARSAARSHQGSEHVRFSNRDRALRVRTDRKLIEEMRVALRLRQFEVVYAPKLSVPGHEIAGVEALARWRHPQRGELKPRQFVPFAEDHRLAAEIDRQVIEIVLNDLQVWSLQKLVVPAVFVNLSFDFLARPDAARSIYDMLAMTELKPDLFGVEIRESLLARRMGDIVLAAHQFREIGVGVCLDEFGVGGLPLSMLRTVPADELKIDSVFVNELDRSKTRAVVETMASLGHSLDMKVCAKGVASQEQAGFLAAVGCDVLQGPLFSDAATAFEFAGRIGAKGVSRVEPAAVSTG